MPYPPRVPTSSTRLACILLARRCKYFPCASLTAIVCLPSVFRVAHCVEAHTNLREVILLVSLHGRYKICIWIDEKRVMILVRACPIVLLSVKTTLWAFEELSSRRLRRHIDCSDGLGCGELAVALVAELIYILMYDVIRRF